MTTTPEEQAALTRIRILRRDSYRCRFRYRETAPTCGAPAGMVGSTPLADEQVALCARHGLSK